jgi:ArsR family transcriptional regulator
MTDTRAPSSADRPDAVCCVGTIDPVAADEAAALAGVLAALADPVRLQILSIIGRSTSGEVCACDFVGPIDRSQPTISHHLKVLAEAGVVTGDKRGRWVWYRVVPERLSDVQRALVALAG